MVASRATATTTGAEHYLAVAENRTGATRNKPHFNYRRHTMATALNPRGLPRPQNGSRTGAKAGGRRGGRNTGGCKSGGPGGGGGGGRGKGKGRTG